MGDARTVKVRIAVAVDENGGYGCSIHMPGETWENAEFFCDGQRYNHVWLEADVPLPDAPTIPATVTKAEEGE